MRIEASKNLPEAQDLVEVLRREFSGNYSYKLFGLGQKSVLVGKSTLVGAQISIRQNEVSIISSPPSIFGSLLLSAGLTELAVFLIPFFFTEGLSLSAKYTKLEREIGTFLKRKYG